MMLDSKDLACRTCRLGSDRWLNCTANGRTVHRPIDLSITQIIPSDSKLLLPFCLFFCLSIGVILSWLSVACQFVSGILTDIAQRENLPFRYFLFPQSLSFIFFSSHEFYLQIIIVLLAVVVVRVVVVKRDNICYSAPK